MSIEAQGLDQAAAHIASLPTVAQQTQAREIRALGQRYLEALKAETPGGGKLRSAYSVTENYTALEASYRIANDAPYLGFVIKGRGPIEAKTGKALRFEIGGQVLFRKRVGPSKPNPFPERAARAMAPYVDQVRATLPGIIVRDYSAS